MNKAADKELVEAATPYIRSVVALAIFLRYGRNEITSQQAYGYADQFIKQLKTDMEEE